MMSLVTIPRPYICGYCNVGFTKETTLGVHICEQKRRALARKERHVVLAYDTFLRFYRRAQPQSTQEKTYEDFCKSPYYNAFIKFGSFVSNVNPLYPEKFIDYVVTSGVKLDHWCRDELYEQYVLDLIRRETVETALQRSLQTMMDWGDAHNASWNHYFLYVSLSRACYDIKDGKISPWVILNSSNGKDMLKKFSDEQLGHIQNIIDLSFWLNKFKKMPADAALVKEVVKESNI
jgi:hypothetical protein